MAAEIVIAIYRAKPGKEDELKALIDGHVPMLREQGLATDRETVLMKSMKDGTFLEVFEWVSADAMREAHTHEVVGKTWGAMGEVADFMTLADLQEATTQFPHFVGV